MPIQRPSHEIALTSFLLSLRARDAAAQRFVLDARQAARRGSGLGRGAGGRGAAKRQRGDDQGDGRLQHRGAHCQRAR